MEPVTAALIGTAIGFVGTLGAGYLNPFTTAHHTRAAKNLEVRRDAYTAGLAAVERLAYMDAAESFKRAMSEMTGALARMRLVASHDIADLYHDIIKAAEAIRKDQIENSRVPAEELFDEFGRALKAFTEAARADIGVDD